MEGATTLAAACRALLTHQIARTDAVAAAACCRTAGDLEAVAVIDHRLLATRPAREGREASTRIGRRLIETAAAAERHPWIRAARDGVRAGLLPGNQACMLGVIAGALALSPDQTATLTLWSAANGLLSAAMRLLRITHDDVQAILTALRPLMTDLAAQAARADPADIAGSAPQFELWSMRHETVAMRLFAS